MTQEFSKEEFAKRDKFAEYLGIELLEAENGFARTRIKLSQKHLNGMRLAHGGLIFSLADLAFAAAANSHGPNAVAVNASISYMNPVHSGELTATARENSKSRKLAHYTMEVANENGEICALMQGMVYRMAKKGGEDKN